MSLIEFRRADLGYGSVPVLAGVEFEIPPLSFVGILGHNGSGKTTLLKTTLGLIAPLRGQVLRHGARPGLPRFGYVPQKERLDPIFPLSAFDVAVMGTYSRVEPLQRLRGLQKKGLVERCLAEAGASELAGRPYSDLSGGQRQRVMIARALAAEPEILALDEPLAGIDVTTQKSLLALLRRLKEERGLAVMMVSHRVQAEKDLFTHVVWCDQGRAELGPAAQMLSSGRLSEVFKSEP